MSIAKRAVAAAEILFVFPSALFLTALIARGLQPVQYEPARSAQAIVDWFSQRPAVALWGVLIALPFAVLVSGGVALVRVWKSEAEVREAARQALATARTHFATLLLTITTLVAGAIFVVVALHLITD